MTITRRQMMAGASAMALLPSLANAQQQSMVLEARIGEVQLVEGDYPKTKIWGFNGGVPGPEIRLAQGARVQRRLLNNLPQATAIHWHGLRIDNAMDGVPGLTQDVVPVGQDFTYDFTPPDAGTFWYHAHNQSTEQVARGLFGVLVVEEDQAPEVDHDITVIVDDWRLTEQAQISANFDAPHDWTHGGRIGNYIDARLMPDITAVQQNQRLRLRFVNVATDRIMQLAVFGLDGHVVALDGMPLLQPETAKPLVLAPAQRVDLIVDVTEASGGQAGIALRDRDQWVILKQFTVTGSQGTAPRDKVTALPPNPVARLTDVVGAQNVALKMEGGAMGGLRQGVYQGQLMDTQELVGNGQIWTFNGVAGMSDAPLAEVGKGEVLRIPIQNETVFPHAMHMHGNHFQEVLPDGSFGPLRDTLLVQRGETREIAFVAENPGDWLLHCHMLSHQAAGMKTWIKVNT